MKVFISWSGDTSRRIAEALRDWLPMAIQAVKPYMNERDNEAGVRWGEVVSAELQDTDFGILCLTPDNLKSTWLNFEAGALGKAVDSARVVPLMYRLTPASVEPPLGMFMAKALDKQGVKDTLETINKHLDPERYMDQAALDGAFKALWPLLEEKLNDVETNDLFDDPEPRKDREILEEILELTRDFSRPGDSAGGNLTSVVRIDDSVEQRLQQVLGPGFECLLIEGRIYVKESAKWRAYYRDATFSAADRVEFHKILNQVKARGFEVALSPQIVKSLRASSEEAGAT
jgi:hypothetical protein